MPQHTNERTASQHLASALSQLERIVGHAAVSTDPERLRLFSMDFSETHLERADAIVAPADVDQVVDLVQLANSLRLNLTVRGGGMSYTLGYAPRDPGTVMVDMSAMNRILEINEQDRFMTVEPGVTWAQIDKALADRPVSLRFRGTMSGFAATVGGGLSNNAVGHGQGDITTDLAGIQVVLPKGELIETGARSISPDRPGIATGGPDFTGVFVNDAGALGIKTAATFRLQPGKPSFCAATFGYRTEAEVVAALQSLAVSGLAVNAFSFGDYHHKVFTSRPPPGKEQARALAKTVIQQAGNPVRGALRLAAMPRPGGVGFLNKHPWTLTIICEGFDNRTAGIKCRRAGKILRQHGGRSLPPTLGYALLAEPFQPIGSLINGFGGECSIPTNCTVPPSAAQEVIADLERFFADHSDTMQKHGLFTARLHLLYGSMFGVEPLIYWPDRLSPLRLSVADSAEHEALSQIPANPEARDIALQLRKSLVREVFAKHQPGHAQLGKYYPLQDALATRGSWDMLQRFKASVDPNGLMNPGGLGLD